MLQQPSWVRVAEYSDRLSAEGVLGLLTGADIPAYIASNEHVPGLGTSFAVLVPSELLWRAHWILRAVQVSERELTYLATGELPETTGE